MKNIIPYVVLLVLPAMLSAQYRGGNGAGSTSAAVSDVPLPVGLVSFTGRAELSRVALAWKTATEVNNLGFAVERRAADDPPPPIDTWAEIGFVAGMGSTNVPQSYTFVDTHASGKAAYRLKQIDRDGTFVYSPIVEVVAAGAPNVFALSQNYPNPFNPTTDISFTVPSDGRATLKIFNVVGQEAATLYNGRAQAGTYYRVRFNASGFASGIYVSRLEHDGSVQCKKLLLLNFGCA